MAEAAERSSTYAANDDDAVAPKDNEGLFTWIKDCVKDDREHWLPQYKEIRESAEFVAGHQWTDEDKELLNDQERPVITFNRTEPTVASIVGLEIGNRREVQYIPREQGDVKKNEQLSAVADWARDETEAEDEESDMFWDAVVGGIGWTETRWSYDEDPEGMVALDRVDGLEMVPDKNARKRNLKDAKRIARVRTMPCKDALALVAEYGDFEEDELDADWARYADKDDPHNADPEAAYSDVGNSEGAAIKEEVTLVHFQWIERQPVYKVAIAPGQTEMVSPEDFKIIKKRAPGVKSVKLTKPVYMQAWVGSKILYKGPAPCPEGFSWQCVTGKRDKKTNTWYGIVRPMMDPQMWANKFLSQYLHIFNTNAKGGVMAEKSAFADAKQAEDSWARSDRITWLNDGALAAGRIQQKPMPTFPTGIDALMQFAIASIRDVSGVNLELLGLKDQQQAGILEAQRKQAGMTILAMLFDSLKRYRKRQGGVMLYYITNYLGDGRLVKIMGEGSEQYIQFFHEPGTAKYDVIVDDAPSSPNQKETTWNIIMQLVPQLGPILTPEDWLALAEYSPLPTSIIEKLKAASAKKAEAGKPEQEAIKQMAIDKHNAEVAEAKAKAEDLSAAAELKRAQATAAANPVAPQGEMVDPAVAQAEATKAMAEADRAQALAEQAWLQVQILQGQVAQAPLQQQVLEAKATSAADGIMQGREQHALAMNPPPPLEGEVLPPEPPAPPAPAAPDPGIAEMQQGLAQIAQMLQALMQKPDSTATLGNAVQQLLSGQTEVEQKVDALAAAMDEEKTFEYDEDGQPTAIVSSSGKRKPIKFDETGRVLGA